MVVLDPKLDDLLIAQLQENLIAIALLLEVDIAILADEIINLHDEIEDQPKPVDMLDLQTKKGHTHLIAHQLQKKHFQKEDLTNIKKLSSDKY